MQVEEGQKPSKKNRENKHHGVKFLTENWIYGSFREEAIMQTKI